MCSAVENNRSSVGVLKTWHIGTFIHPIITRSLAVSIVLSLAEIIYRVTTCLENLEMSWNLKHVMEMSGMLLTVREMSGKKILSWKSVPKLFITKKQ